MILYWAYPTDGTGHATRATSICRWLDTEVLVVRGIDDPTINRPLDECKIPYKVIEDKVEGIQFVKSFGAKTVVMDDRCGSALDRYASLYIWRMGRPEHPSRPIPKIRIEGPRSLWPVLILEDDEILSKEEARDDLGLPQDEPLIIGVPSLCRPGVVESTKPDFLLDRWPALKWMRAADHIVGCIGANLYGEVNYLGIPVTWIKAPNTPDQAIRISSQENVGLITKEAGKQVARMIEDRHGRS